MATINYGLQGSGLGASQQAKLDKLMTTELADKMIFDRYATIQKALPEKSGKSIKFRRWVPMKHLMLLNEIYTQVANNDVTGKGEGILISTQKGIYNDIILQEGSSGSEKGKMKVVELESEVFPIGMWMTVTEEVDLFHDMYTLSEHIRQYSEVAAFHIDTFYRDTYIDGAGHVNDITGNSDPDDKVTSSSFTDAVSKTSLQLRVSGAKYVSSILTSSPNYETTPVWGRYVGLVHPTMGEDIRNNADFVPLEKYASGVKVLEGEIGMIKDIRIVESENMLAEDNGDGTYKGYMLIMGQDHTANIPLRGRKRIEVIVKGRNNDDKSDPLNRFGMVGWKSWLGALTVNPERIGLVVANYNI